MGALITKPPARVVLPDDDEEDSVQLGSDFVDTEKQQGEDTLGIAENEEDYPDPEPPVEDISPRGPESGALSRVSFKSPAPVIAPHVIAEEDNVDENQLPNSVAGSTVAKTTAMSIVSHRLKLANGHNRQGTPSKISRIKLRQGYPLSGLPAANLISKGGLPTQSVINSDAIMSRSFITGDLNQTSISLDDGRRMLTKREIMLIKRERFEIRAMMGTRAEERTHRSQLTARSEFKPPEVIEDISPLTNFDYSAADRKAEECRDHRAESYAALINDLTSGLETDALKVWAILSWISKQRIGKIGFGDKIPKPNTPNGYMKLIQDGQGTYPAFFTLLCRHAGIKCAIIHGVSKSAKYEVGDANVEDLRNTWNAVYVEGNWRLVHPLWVCRSLKGHQQGGWMTIEKAGKALAQIQHADNGQDVATYNKYYIFTDPKEFVYRNLPDDERWQLLKEPWSMEKFVQMPYVRPEFFERGFKYISDGKCVLASESGEKQVIAVGFSQSIHKDLVFSYELSYALQGDEHEDVVSQRPKNVGRYILVLKQEDQVTIEIRFPCTGTYRLRLYAGLYTDFGDDPPWISDVRIKCRADPQQQSPLPYNPGVVGWGPGPIAESFGLHVPSHDTGLIDLTEDEITIIQFIMVRKVQIKAELLSIRMNAEFLSQFVKHDLIEVSEAFELRITLTCPKRSNSEELALRLEAWSQESMSMENACNYVMRTRKERPHETFYVRKARKMLSDAMISSDVKELEDAIETCDKQSLHADDLEVKGGKTRLDFLQCRSVLRNSLLVNRIEVSESAISRSKSARFHVLLSRDIKKAEAHLRQIRELNSGGWSNRIPEIDRSTLMELSHLRKPREEIRHVLVAMFILLGVDEEELFSWKRIQQLLRSEENTLVEMARLERDLNVEGLQIVSPAWEEVEKAQEILDTYSEEEIRRIDNTAAAFYQWVSTVMVMLRERRQKEHPGKQHRIAKVPKLNDIAEASEYSRYARTGKQSVMSSMKF